MPEVAAKFKVPNSHDTDAPEATDKFPYIFWVTFHAIVITHEAGFPKVKLAQFVVAVSVTVYAVAFDALSNITLSAEVGTENHHAPPEVSLQCVVVEASQFHVPPTQYLFAIIQ